MLLGKPMRVSPSLASAFSSLGLQGSLIFGDLSHIVVRSSRPQLQRSFELSESDITAGLALYTFRARADASFFDPRGGVTPPCTQWTIS